MKILMLVALVGIMSFSTVGCFSTETNDSNDANGNVNSVQKPTVSYVPVGWSLYESVPYPQVLDEVYGVNSGLLDYTDDGDGDFVQIYYGDMPSVLKGNANSSSALIEAAIAWSTSFTPQETGTMTVAGHLASYTKVYDSLYAMYEMEIVFVIGSTCIDIYTMFDATTQDEDQVMSLINSIYIS